MRAVPMRRHWLPRNVSMASRGVPHRAVSASLRTEGERSRGSENMLRYGTSGCPVRALRSAAGRRVHWKSRRYLRLVFLIFGVKGGRHWRLCQFFWHRTQEHRNRRRAREPTDANRCDGLVGRTGPGIPPGRLFRPLARGFALMHAARRSTKGRTQSMRCVTRSRRPIVRPPT